MNLPIEKIEDFFSVVERTFGFLDDVKKNRFIRYRQILMEWNERMNLISRKEINILERHFLNSLSVAYFTPFKPFKKVADIGSGGGFPAVPLKILSPSIHFVLFETIRKKVEFLRAVVQELHLDHIQIVHRNVEHVHGAAEFSGTFDYVTVRAVAQVGTLVSMSAPLLRPYGQMLFLKGKNYHNEMNSVATFQGYRLVKDYPLAECPLFSSPQDGHLLVMAKRHASKRHFA